MSDSLESKLKVKISPALLTAVSAKRPQAMFLMTLFEDVVYQAWVRITIMSLPESNSFPAVSYSFFSKISHSFLMFR